MSTATLSFIGEAVPVAIREVEHELQRQLMPGDALPEHAVHLARMSNLVVFCDSDARAEQIATEIPAIVAVHPARVLFLIGDLDNKEPGVDGVDAWVRAWCRVGSGQQRICTEEVILKSRGAGLDRLPFCVRGLLLGDLPTNLWWAASRPPAYGGAFLFDLSEHAEQIVYDSIGWIEPAKAVAATGAWLSKFEREGALGRRRVVSDLNWRRLKYWRRMLGQSLAPASAPGAIESITEVAVEHGPHAVVQAWQLASWLASKLSWQVQDGHVHDNVEINWPVVAPHGRLKLRIQRLASGRPVVQRMRIACTINDVRGALVFNDDNGQRLSVVAEGQDAAPRTLTTKTEGIAELASRQFCDREFDPVFQESMAVAQILAQHVS